MTSVMMIKIMLSPLPDRAGGKSSKTCLDPPAITALQRTIKTKQRRSEGRSGRWHGWRLGAQGVGRQKLGNLAGKRVLVVLGGYERSENGARNYVMRGSKGGMTWKKEMDLL